MTSKIKTSLITASLIVAASAFTGCGGGSDDTPQLMPTTTTVTGSVIDGYVKGARVEMGTKSAVTNDSGVYTLTFSTDENITSSTLTASGGIDNDTGESFGGVLKTVYDVANKDSLVATPLTTLVAVVYASNTSVTGGIESVKNSIAKSLGIDAVTLVSDFKKTTTTTTENNSSKALKAALQIQKTVEVFANVASGSTATTDTKNLNFTRALANLGTQLKTNADNNSTITLANTLTVENLKGADINVSSINATDLNSTLTTFVKLTNDINTSSTVSVASQAKALEVIVSAVKEAVKDNNISTVKNTVYATVAQGGITEIANKIKTAEAGVTSGSATTVSSIMATLKLDDKNATASASKVVEVFINAGADVQKLATSFADVNTSDTNTTAILNKILADVNTTGSNMTTVNLNSVVNEMNTTVTAAKDANITVKTAAQIQAEINAKEIASATAIDKLRITDNKVKIGDTEVTLVAGKFSVTKTKLANTTTALSPYYNVSFGLDDISAIAGVCTSDTNCTGKYTSFEDGDSFLVDASIEIDDKNTNKFLKVVINDVNISRTSSGTNYAGFINADARNCDVNATGTKADNVTVNSNFKLDNSDSIVTINNDGTLGFNVGGMINQMSGKISGTTLENIKADFTVAGSYTVTLKLMSKEIDGIDGAIKTTDANGINTYTITGTVTVQ